LFTDENIGAIVLTLKLASLTTLILLLIGTPIAWWLARTRSWLKGPVGAMIALPIVLPPTVIGFYLLVTMGPNGPIGQLTPGDGSWHPAFQFLPAWWLVRFSIRCHSSCSLSRMPLKRWVTDPLEVAATLRASH
jgi:molybdate transport system permease protein